MENLNHIIERWAAGLGMPLEAVVRLILAAAAGGLIGLEREMRGRQAGFRTNLLVCLGSALVMIVSISFATYSWKTHPNINLNIDPARIAYGVMTGIGFIGAGTIIQTRGSIRGLTTAAAMWCVAALGLAAGFGLYFLCILSTLLILIALWILDYFEDMLPKFRHRIVTVRRKWYPGCISDTIERFKSAKFRVVDVSFERTDDLLDADISLVIAFMNKKQYYTFEKQLEGDTDCQLLSAREM